VCRCFYHPTLENQNTRGRTYLVDRSI
jgi:hypothetical protein